MSKSEQYITQAADDEYKTYYTNDTDPQKAGQGLAFAPLVFQVLEADRLDYWMMSPSEQMGMIYLLEHMRPNELSAHLFCDISEFPTAWRASGS